MNMNSFDVLQWLKSFTNDENVIKTFEEDAPFPSNDTANIGFTPAYTDDYTVEDADDRNRDSENSSSSDQYDEVVNIDCPLFTETILDDDKEIFDLKIFRKYYTVQNTNETIPATKKKDKDLPLTYRDGSAAIFNKSLQKNKNSFLVQLYNDEVSITNPIGPKKDEKKLTLFYYILDDLPHTVRSMLDSIDLFGICLSKVLSNSTNRQIYFDAMVNDLNELQSNGLTLSTCTRRLYFVFDLIAADNLAANDLGEFQKNFNNGYFCRMCYISYTYKYIPLTEISFLLRSESSHERHLCQVLQSSQLVFGINNRSNFANLIEFHPIKSSPFDIMQDFSKKEEIDGKLLLSLRYEEVKSLFPKLKQRTIFADERDKLSNNLFSQNNQSSSKPEGDDQDNQNDQPVYIDESLKSSDSIPLTSEIIIENTDLLSSSFHNNHSDDEQNDTQVLEKGTNIQEDYE
ncbi:unnamed protein product [Rotaria sp. Silwood2]|nr:unnamed protein product [Rotaria sp. Silwood2]CAF4256170.1 unnamed protein product [Rotaria sp. Silwood2]